MKCNNVFKYILISVFFLIGIKAFSNGQADNSFERKSAVEKNLILTIEKYIKFREIKDGGLIWDWVKSKIAIIPINKSIIDACIEYKSAEESLTEEERNRLFEQNYSEYLNGSHCCFAVFIINTYESTQNWDNDCRVYIKNIKEDVVLQDENLINYRLKKVTPTLGNLLSPGWNTGYLYFDNFRLRDNNSYSIEFKNYIVDSDWSDKSHHSVRGEWSFTFDETNLNYLSLIRKGISTEVIRSNYSIGTFASKGIGAAEAVSIITNILSIIGLLL